MIACAPGAIGSLVIFNSSGEIAGNPWARDCDEVETNAIKIAVKKMFGMADNLGRLSMKPRVDQITRLRGIRPRLDRGQGRAGSITMVENYVRCRNYGSADYRGGAGVSR
jgi:hypothetical protein